MPDHFNDPLYVTMMVHVTMIPFFLLQRFPIYLVMMEGKAGFIPASIYIHAIFALVVVIFYGVLYMLCQPRMTYQIDVLLITSWVKSIQCVIIPRCP